MDTKKIRPAESGNDAKREKVRVIPIQFFDDFPGHPFYVKMDEEMKALARTFYGIEKDIAKLADILGHASINTTRIYIVTTGAEHKRKMEHMRLII